MPKVKLTSSMNHVVFCQDEDELHDTMQVFEEYLMREGMKPFVKIGSVYHDNCSFDFRITTDEQEEKDIIYRFFKMNEPVAHSTYRIWVQKGKDSYYYPFNDLKTALLVFKVLQQEIKHSTMIELAKYHPHSKGDWIIWKDRQGRTAKELQLQIHNEELSVDLFTAQ
jgi:hypothetical protein